MPLCRTTAKKTSIASASIFFILCFLLSLLRNAFVTKLKECSNHDEILYICCLVFEILLLVSCVRAPEDLFLPESCNRAAGKKLLDVFIGILLCSKKYRSSFSQIQCGCTHIFLCAIASNTFYVLILKHSPSFSFLFL